MANVTPSKCALDKECLAGSTQSMLSRRKMSGLQSGTPACSSGSSALKRWVVRYPMKAKGCSGKLLLDIPGGSQVQAIGMIFTCGTKVDLVPRGIPSYSQRSRTTCWSKKLCVFSRRDVSRKAIYGECSARLIPNAHFADFAPTLRRGSGMLRRGDVSCGRPLKRVTKLFRSNSPICFWGCPTVLSGSFYLRRQLGYRGAAKT